MCGKRVSTIGFREYRLEPLVSDAVAIAHLEFGYPPSAALEKSMPARAIRSRNERVRPLSQTIKDT
jgi:hypothetical protein